MKIVKQSEIEIENEYLELVEKIEISPIQGVEVFGNLGEKNSLISYSLENPQKE